MLPGGREAPVRAVLLPHRRGPACGLPVLSGEARILADALEGARHVFIFSDQCRIVRDAEAQDLSHNAVLFMATRVISQSARAVRGPPRPLAAQPGPLSRTAARGPSAPASGRRGFWP